MSRFHSYINTARKVLEEYQGGVPFNIFLKDFFRSQKKFGSGDRKQIAHLCYSFFRLGKANYGDPTERIYAANFLCSTEINEILKLSNPELAEYITKSVEQKLEILKIQPGSIFPWANELSTAIEPMKFSESFLVQPDLFIRIRPGRHKLVYEKLNEQKIVYSVREADGIRIPNATKIESILQLEKDVVIQDLNSQRIGAFIRSATDSFSDISPVSIYDCCAASGGKSILASDILGNISLTVSDVRSNILQNLRRRFSTAGINSYKLFEADLSKSSCDQHVRGDGFDLIIADLPCTGSGTWSRTPEQLYFFQPEKIEYYSQLQKRILDNVIPCLKKFGRLLYSTCSVFKKENEEIATYLEIKFGLRLLNMQILPGYEEKADTMFAALFEKVT